MQQKDLCNGLCSVKILSKIEAGEYHANIFLCEMLLQRLGASLDKYEIVLFPEEYEEICLRDEITESIEKGHLEKAEEQVNNFLKQVKEAGSVQKQYFYRMKAVILSAQGKHKESLILLQKAIRITLPQINTEDTKEYYFAIEEVEILMMMAYEYIRCHNKEKADQLIAFLVKYTKKHYKDKSELVKVYPKAVYLLALSKGGADECVRECEEAFNLLCEEGVFLFLPEIMSLLEATYKKMGVSEKYKRIHCQLKSVKWVEKLCDYSLHIANSSLCWFKNPITREYHLCSEWIMGQRKIRGLKREELIEEIYENVESLARVENNKQHPNWNTYKKLMTRLGLPPNKMIEYLVTEDDKQLESRRNIAQFLSKVDLENAKIELGWLKGEIDGEIPWNKQYITYMEAMLDYHLKIINAEELYVRITQALKETYSIYGEDLWRTPTRQEANMVNQIGIALWEEGKKLESYQYFSSFMQLYKNSKIKEKYHYASKALLNINYTRVVRRNSQFEEASKLCLSGMKYEFCAGKCHTLGSYIEQLAYIIEATEGDLTKRKKTEEVYLRNAFYLNDMLHCKARCKYLDRYYRKLFNLQVEWYS